MPQVAAVWSLQCEGVTFRMQGEYGVDTKCVAGPWKRLSWGSPKVPPAAIDDSMLPTGARLADDAKGQPVILFGEEWSLNFFAERHPKIGLSPLPYDVKDELD